MIDPFTAITLLSSYATGQKIGGLLANWAYGKNAKHLQKGIEYFFKGIDNHNTEFIDKAITEFDQIDENDDRLFVVAASYLYRAICYTYLLKFSLAYHFLDKLEAIDYDFFTRKKDTIEELKSNGRDFRPEIRKMEIAVKDALSESDSPSEINWKKVSIILLIVLGIGGIAALLLILI